MRTSLVVAYVLLALFCVVPVVMVLAGSFIGEDGGLTLDHYRKAFGASDLVESLWNSILISSLATVFALLLGLPYAFFATRVRIPLRGMFSALYVLPLVLPPLLMSMGWSQFLRSFRPEDALGPGPESFLGGIKGSAFLLALAYFPFVVLFSRKAFLEIGAGLEEAARISVGPIRAFLRVTLPLSLPAILVGGLFVFLFSIADFTVVDYLSAVLEVKDQVSAYPFKAFWTWKSGGPGVATALGTPIAALSLVLLGVIFWLVRKSRFVSVTSGHVRPGYVEDVSSPVVKLLLRGGGFLFLTTVFVVSVVIPVGRIFSMAFGTKGIGWHMNDALVRRSGMVDVGNSLLYGVLAAIVMSVLAVILAHHMVRKGPKWEALILGLSLLPLVFGPIMFGVGLMRTWNHTWLETADKFNPIYQTLVIVVFLLVGKYLPFALAAASSSLKRIDPGYEEAAAVAGVSPGRRMLGVVAPLMAKGIAGGFVLGLIFSLRELDTMYMFDAGNRTLMMKIYSWVHLVHDANVASLSLVLILLIAIPLLLYWLLTARRLRIF